MIYNIQHISLTEVFPEDNNWSKLRQILQKQFPIDCKTGTAYFQTFQLVTGQMVHLQL